jgi:hypothetical protein
MLNRFSGTGGITMQMFAACRITVSGIGGAGVNEEPDALIHVRDKGTQIMCIDANTPEARQ